MTTQKDIARALDRAADRSGSPATGKQCWFLAGLIARAPSAEIDYNGWLLDTSEALSKKFASEMIEFYLGAEKRAA